MERRQFIVLDSWRGLSAMAIVVYHLHVGDWIWQQTLYKNMFLLVDFFFVLSGFVLEHAYAHRIADMPAASGFLLKRLGRVWPMHVVALTFLAGLESAELVIGGAHGASDPFTGQYSPSGLIWSFLLLDSWAGRDSPVWNVPSWSISAEVFSYVIFAILCLCGGRRRALWVLCLACASGMFLWQHAYFLKTTTQFGAVRCLYGFCIGILCYRIVSHFGHRDTRRPPWLLSLIELACCSAIILVLSFIEDMRALFFMPICFAAMVGVFSVERGALSSLLGRSPFRFLGAVSYTVYIIHVPIMRAIYKVARFSEIRGWTGPIYRDIGGGQVAIIVGSPWNVWLCYSAVVGLILAVAAVCYRQLESPARQWFREQGDRLEAVMREANRRDDRA